jgi:uncharacterized membrane protein YtjA (UPF0391 family)
VSARLRLSAYAPLGRAGELALRFSARIHLRTRRVLMLYYAAVFFVIALIAAIFGFTGIAAGAAEVAKILFLIFVVLFAISLVIGLLRGRGP